MARIPMTPMGSVRQISMAMMATRTPRVLMPGRPSASLAGTKYIPTRAMTAITRPIICVRLKRVFFTCTFVDIELFLLSCNHILSHTPQVQVHCSIGRRRGAILFLSLLSNLERFRRSFAVTIAKAMGFAMLFCAYCINFDNNFWHIYVKNPSKKQRRTDV